MQLNKKKVVSLHQYVKLSNEQRHEKVTYDGMPDCDGAFCLC